MLYAPSAVTVMCVLAETLLFLLHEAVVNDAKADQAADASKKKHRSDVFRIQDGFELCDTEQIVNERKQSLLSVV